MHIITKYKAGRISLLLVVFIGLLLVVRPTQVSSLGSNLISADGAEFLDRETLRVCVFLHNGIAGAPVQAGFSVRGTVDWNGGPVSFDVPVAEMEIFTLDNQTSFATTTVTLGPDDFPDDISVNPRACVTLHEKSGVEIDDGACATQTCSL